MYLYPFWILLGGLLGGLLLMKTTRRSVYPFVLSFLCALSSFLVFCLFLFYTKPLSLTFFHGILLFELNLMNVSFCILTVGISLPFFLVWFWSKGEEKRMGLFFIMYLMFVSSVGLILSSGIYSFVFFLELTFLLFLFLVRNGGSGDSLSCFDCIVYFGPTLLFGLGMAYSLLLDVDMGRINEFHMTLFMRVIFAMSFSARLLHS